MIIECVFFDGAIVNTEADEYVQVLNNAGVSVDLLGWTVRDVSEGEPAFTFQDSFLLEPGQRVRVYTNQVNREWVGFSFGWPGPVWNNNQPDVAGLSNPAGHLISAQTYPPGCE